MHDKIKAAEVFEKYLSRIENETHRVRMREVLEWTKTRFPGLEPKIAWNQPVFTDHGTFIIGFSAAKQHFSVAPEPAAIRKFSREIQASGYSQGTQHNGNDDLHSIRDIEIPTLVGDCHPGTVEEMVCFAADTIFDFSHRKPPVKIWMIWYCCMYQV